jgi:glycogen debranching enzyme
MESLLSDPMWTGWGIRTLSEEARRFNPVAYHRGTVWPHDNALIAAGFRRYGFDDAACQVFEGIVEASTHFPLHRLPELFAGFRRSEYGIPVRYPVACHPQAWAASSVPFMLEKLLGLAPEAFETRLRVVRPILPPSTRVVTLRGLRVGCARVDLAFTRQPDGHADVEVLKQEGEIDVEVEPNGTELCC